MKLEIQANGQEAKSANHKPKSGSCLSCKKQEKDWQGFQAN
jgi:hypothetical protein